MWYYYPMGYCLAIKRNEVLIHFTTLVNLTDIIPSEKSQSQKLHIVSFHLQEMSRIGKSTETESSGFLRAFEEKDRVTANGTKYSLRVMKMF
jgi:hypothetical protein